MFKKMGRPAKAKKYKAIQIAINAIPSEKLALTVIMKNTKLSLSQVGRYVIAEGLKVLMPMTRDEIVRGALQYEAAREVEEKHAKK